MDWVKLAVDFFDDERIEVLDDAAEVMFLRGLARAGKVGRGGFIPESSLPKLTRRRRHEPLVNELVESGLWTRVAGGVQVTSWSDWQDAFDELAKRRAADRERQRNRRQRLREQQESTVSRDTSRDVTPPEGEEDKDPYRDLGGKGYVPARASEPPSKCPKHRNNPNTLPCGACADARREHDQWRADRAAEIRACRLCNADGQRWDPAGKHRGTVGRCDHKPLSRQETA